MMHTLSFDIFELFLFQMRPATQIVRQTMAVGTPGFPAILVDLLTLLGYR